MNKRTTVLFFAAAALLGSVATGLAFPAAKKSQTVQKVAVGDEAPSFVLSDTDGHPLDVAPYIGSKVMVLWFTNLCPGCQASLPAVTALKDRFKGSSVEVVGVIVPGAEELAAFRQAMKSARADFLLLLDKDGQASERYTGVRLSGGVCPLTNLYVIDLRGQVSYVGHLPGVSDKELQAVVNSSLLTKGKYMKGEER